jgi:uracil-DNA glycosylase
MTDRKYKGKINVGKMKTIYNRCMKCEECSLHESATHKVFGGGPINSPIMLIGEAPRQDEDESGKPFVGRVGTLLSKLLCFSGIMKERCYITNICKCRPPRNRKPTEDELDVCLPLLLAQIAIIEPKIIACVGGVSCETLGISGAMKSIHGKAAYSTVLEREVFCTYHPIYALYSMDALPSVEADFAGLGEYCSEFGIGGLVTIDVDGYIINWVSANQDFVNSVEIKPGGFSFSDENVVKKLDGFISDCFFDLYDGDLQRLDEMYRCIIISHLYMDELLSTFVQTMLKRIERHIVVLSAYTSKTTSKESVVKYLKECGLLK